MTAAWAGRTVSIAAKCALRSAVAKCPSAYSVGPPHWNWSPLADEPLDARVERDGASDLGADRRGAREADLVGAVREGARHRLAEHLPFRTCRADAAPGDLGRDRSPVARWRSRCRRPATRSAWWPAGSARRRRCRPASPTTARCPGARAGAGAAAPDGCGPRRAASRGSCRRRSRTGRSRRRRRDRSSPTSSSPGVVGTSKPQTSDQRAAVAASTAGTQPISAPPCTPEWPRIGTRPAVGVAGQRRAPARRSSAR